MTSPIQEEPVLSGVVVPSLGIGQSTVDIDLKEIPKNCVPRLCTITCKHIVFSPAFLDILNTKPVQLQLACRLKGRNQGAINGKNPNKRMVTLELPLTEERELDIVWSLPYVHNLKGPGETLRLYLQTKKKRPLCMTSISMASVLQRSLESVVVLLLLSEKGESMDAMEPAAWLTVVITSTPLDLSRDSKAINAGMSAPPTSKQRLSARDRDDDDDDSDYDYRDNRKPSGASDSSDEEEDMNAPVPRSARGAYSGSGDDRDVSINILDQRPVMEKRKVPMSVRIAKTKGAIREKYEAYKKEREAKKEYKKKKDLLSTPPAPNNNNTNVNTRERERDK